MHIKKITIIEICIYIYIMYIFKYDYMEVWTWNNYYELILLNDVASNWVAEKTCLNSSAFLWGSILSVCDLGQTSWARKTQKMLWFNAKKAKTFTHMFVSSFILSMETSEELINAEICHPWICSVTEYSRSLVAIFSDETHITATRYIYIYI